MAGQGMMYTWGDEVTKIRTITNLITIIDPQDTPCVSYFGTNNWDKFGVRDYPNGQYEWLSDTLRVRSTTIGAGGVAGGATTDVPVNDPHLFKIGDVWFDPATGELLRVTAADGTSPVTFERDYGGTSLGAAIAQDATLEYKFSARDEGADSDSTPFTTPTSMWNQSQIFHAEIKLTGSERNATTRYGIPDQYLYQLQKWLGGAGAGAGQMGRAGDLMIDLENTFFYGQRVTRDENNSDGAMGGAYYYIDSANKLDLSGAAPAEDDLMDAMQLAWSKGGKPNLIIANATNKRLISSWYRDTVRTERSERTGGVIIDVVDTEFGTLNIMLNRWCQPTKIYGVQSDMMGWVPLRPWFVEPLAKGGDWTKDELIGEYGFVLKHPEAHFVLENTA
jgi:hypothetical protein